MIHKEFSTDLACQFTDDEALEFYFLLKGILHFDIKSSMTVERGEEQITPITKHTYTDIDIKLAFVIIEKKKRRSRNARYMTKKLDNNDQKELKKKNNESDKKKEVEDGVKEGIDEFVKAFQKAD
jgi:hypothetical protein